MKRFTSAASFRSTPTRQTKETGCSISYSKTSRRSVVPFESSTRQPSSRTRRSPLSGPSSLTSAQVSDSLPGTLLTDYFDLIESSKGVSEFTFEAIAIDYEKYFVSYTCSQPEIFGKNLPLHTSNLWVWTRSKTPSNELMHEINEAIADLGLAGPAKGFLKVGQNKCSNT